MQSCFSMYRLPNCDWEGINSHKHSESHWSSCLPVDLGCIFRDHLVLYPEGLICIPCIPSLGDWVGFHMGPHLHVIGSNYYIPIWSDETNCVCIMSINIHLATRNTNTSSRTKSTHLRIEYGHYVVTGRVIIWEHCMVIHWIAILSVTNMFCAFYNV